MNTVENIHRLELILASPFWQDDTRRCVMERITLEITGHGTDYCWRIHDAEDGSYANSKGSFVSLGAAKDTLLRVLEDGLRRQRERSATTH